jgi:hypothetical protein
MSLPENQKNNSGIENIPVEVRKIIFIFLLVVLAIGIGGIWIWSLPQTLNEVNENQIADEKSDSLNIEELVGSLRDSFEQLRLSEEESSTSTASSTPTVPQLNENQTEVLKDRILERETIGWKSYSNREYGFSLLYPEGVVVVEPLDQTQPEVVAKIRNAKNFSDLATINLVSSDSATIQSPNAAAYLEVSPEKIFVFLDTSFSTTTEIMAKTFSLIEE